MALRAKKRWQSKFARFVGSFGVAALASHLDVESAAIYQWIRGNTSPRPLNAQKIQKLAKRRGVSLSLDDIYQHDREVNGLRRSTSTHQPQHARA